MIESRLADRLFLLAGFWLCLVARSYSDDANPVEADYYPITRFEIPQEAVIEGGAFQLMPDGKLAVCCRRGDVWLVDDPFAKQVKGSQFHLFAQGLHEPLSLAERDGWLYVTQRSDVSRIRDSDGDGAADRFEVVGDGWEISGNYHEYAFASKFDREGNLWVTLCLTGSFTSDCKYRGWCVRVTPDGKTIPTTSGIRSPGGMGMNADGEVFYTDNQGPWNGTCALKHLSPGKFVGHPGGFRWYDDCADVMGPRPQEPESGSRFAAEAKKIPEYTPPSVLFPYKRMGQSASGVACDLSGGKFGPFEGQLFVGDQTNSTVMRVFLEKVRGHWQGACFPFREGFGSGIVGLEMTPQGALFAGSTNRGWGARGDVPFAIERVDWSGKVPFEIQTMSARPDGFVLTFTQPVDPGTAGDTASYRMATHTYIFQSTYGSPEVDQTTPAIETATVSDDRLSVTLKVNGLQEGHVHELFAEGVRSHEGQLLLHDAAYYTLMYLAE
jgi:glucose/arabinose dehydrogenase